MRLGGGTVLKLPNIHWRKSIFFRLVITYLLVNIPIVMLGLYLYYWSYNNARNDISSATRTQLTYYLKDLNREVEWIEMQQYDLLKDNKIVKLAVTWELMNSVERRENLNYVLHKISIMKNSSKYIQDVKVHIPSNSKTLSINDSISELDYDEYDALKISVNINQQRISYMNEELNLVAFKYGGGSKRDPLYIVQIELNKNYIKDTLQQLNFYSDSKSVLYFETLELAISSNQDFQSVIERYLDKNLENKATMTLIKLEDDNYHIDQVYSKELDTSIMTFLSEKTLRKPLNFFSKWVWLFVLSSILAIVIVYYTTYKIIHRPLIQLVRGFESMGAGKLNSLIEHDKKDEFGYLYTRYNQMLKKLNNLIDADYKQKMMMQKSELKQLQSQINPHFLYNSFFILNSLAKVGDVERIEQFTVMLGEYFRFITRDKEDFVLLSEEVKHSRIYADIQELRFSRRIRVKFDELPKEMERIKVPRLIIQPIIENAYEHGLEKKSEMGLLHVTFKTLNQAISIIIEDNSETLNNGQLKELQFRLKNVGEANEMTGMMNIHRRLQLIFGDRSGLYLERSELKGLKVTIYIELSP